MFLGPHGEYLGDAAAWRAWWGHSWLAQSLVSHSRPLCSCPCLILWDLPFKIRLAVKEGRRQNSQHKRLRFINNTASLIGTLSLKTQTAVLLSNSVHVRQHALRWPGWHGTQRVSLDAIPALLEPRLGWGLAVWTSSLPGSCFLTGKIGVVTPLLENGELNVVRSLD